MDTRIREVLEGFCGIENTRRDPKNNKVYKNTKENDEYLFFKSEKEAGGIFKNTRECKKNSYYDIKWSLRARKLIQIEYDKQLIKDSKLLPFIKLIFYENVLKLVEDVKESKDQKEVENLKKEIKKIKTNANNACAGLSLSEKEKVKKLFANRNSQLKQLEVIFTEAEYKEMIEKMCVQLKNEFDLQQKHSQAKKEEPNVSALKEAVDEKNHSVKCSHSLFFEAISDSEEMDLFFECPPLQELSKNEAASDLLEDNLIIGENHYEENAKKLLIKNMPDLVNAGFKVLFVEHLLYDDQAKLDKMDAEQIASDHQSHIGKQLDKIDERFQTKPSFRHLVIAAKLAGIRVVGIDTSKIHMGGFSDNSRLKWLNFSAYQIIQREMIPGAKWCALVGGLHVKTATMVPTLPPVVGLAELTGAGNIDLQGAGSSFKFRTEPKMVAKTNLFASSSQPSPTGDSSNARDRKLK